MNITLKKYFFIVTSDKIVINLGRFVSLGANAMAITLFPFIFVRKDTVNNEELLRHEEIHIRQQLELLIFGVVILYFIEYFFARAFKKLSKRQSYYFTAMEQEAHRNAIKEDYLKTRKPYSIIKYIWDKKKLNRDEDGNLICEEY